jgi:N-[(2S)-2-amino-2-carboxyethyl]-L-glutamate dehydrogenase
MNFIETRNKIQELIKQQQIIYLSYDDVKNVNVFDFKEIRNVLKEVYKIHYLNDYKMPVSDYLKYKDRPSYDRIIVLLGYLGGKFNVSGLKEICSSTTNKNLLFERASGLIILNDTQTQRPFAIIEASQISAARTAGVTSISIEQFAPKNIEKVCFIGCGYLAKIHAIMWNQLYRNLSSTINVFDINNENASIFKDFCERELDLKINICNSAYEAVNDADIIIPLTTQEKPYIKNSWIKKTSLYSAVSLLDPEIEVLKASSCIVVDDEKICKQEGRPLEKLENNGDLDAMKLYTIGEILSKPKIMNVINMEKVFFNPMGTVITDLGVAYLVLSKYLNSDLNLTILNV